MADVVKASDCKCCVCGKQAVAFWPVIDPDIPSHPYCHECLQDALTKAFIMLLDGDTKKAKALSKRIKK